MALVRELYEDEYSPEFSSIVIRDAMTMPTPLWLRAPLLDESAGPLWGTVGRAGDGWLQLNAVGGYQRVRLEAHDEAPPPETERWTSVFEMPYFCGTGTVGFTSTTNASPYSGLELGPPGHYRARVGRRPADDEGDIWVVRFWPEPVRPPRWLTRGPDDELDSVGDDIYALVGWAPDGRLETTVAELADALLLDAATVRAALPGEDRPSDGRRDVRTCDHLVVDRRGSALIITGISDAEEYYDEEPGDDEDEVREEAAPDDSPEAVQMRDVLRRYQEEERLAGLRRRPPAGPPPRYGWVGTDIVVRRGDQLVTLAPCPMNDPNTACEVAGGIVVAGDHIVELDRFDQAAYVKEDGTSVDLGALRADFKVSRDGTVLAATELGRGRRGRSALHVIDLVDGTRHALTIDWNPEFFIVGVSDDTVWFRPNRFRPAELSWTVGHAEAVPATRPAPVGSWAGPLAPEHRHYTAHHCGRSFDGYEDITVIDNGERRTYHVPTPGRVDHRVRPVWEDPDHLLLVPGVTSDGGLEFLGCVFRLDVNTGAMQTVATGAHVRTFIHPWPRWTA
ncbi:hypothetical protein KOI35_09725 [Actinoplanes bogorensis]|uniref:DUF4185 domain-containing protein n=1 Tax=Paractinoplanes bogorensis TaxID=1610840 RepID=A0ABS5YL65_9ACTN|nr:hypothetical protein [Actinoplanes bogorensis]MBU2663786.1 hypothetical protein [Actinoplanes bogorensis]